MDKTIHENKMRKPELETRRVKCKECSALLDVEVPKGKALQAMICSSCIHKKQT